MADLSERTTEAAASRKTIAFEQPLNERMRMFLRVEFLHRQVMFHAADRGHFAARAAVAGLLEILSITGRGDVRGDVLKELDRYIEQLGHYQRTPGVDSGRLVALLKELDALRTELSSAGKQFMAPLRESEFLNSIRHRSAIPGGTCMFDLPEYGYWLHLPHEARMAQLNAWIGQLRPLCDAIGQILWLTREASVPKEYVANSGFYQYNLAKTEHYDLIRVLMHRDSGLFPEISAGQHRFTVRFSEWQGVDQRGKQSVADVPFLLALC